MMKPNERISNVEWNGNGAAQRDEVSVLDLRKRLGMTQEQLARELGVTVGTVNRWENGRFRPSPLALRGLERLAERVTQVERMDSFQPALISGGR